MLVFAFQREIWIAQNLNFTVFEDFCLSLSWKYRFSQNVNHTKVKSKTNKYCKFHDDPARRTLPKSRFKKLGMVPKKLYRNTLNPIHFGIKITLDKVVRDRPLKSIKVKLKFPSSAVYRNGPANVFLKG